MVVVDQEDSTVEEITVDMLEPEVVHQMFVVEE